MERRRQTDWHTDRKADRQTKKDIYKDTNTETNKHYTDRKTEDKQKDTYNDTNTVTNGQIDMSTDRHAQTTEVPPLLLLTAIDFAGRPMLRDQYLLLDCGSSKTRRQENR